MENIHMEEEVEFFLNFIVRPEVVTEFARIMKVLSTSYNCVDWCLQPCAEHMLYKKIVLESAVLQDL